MATGEQLGKTGVDINNSIKECKFTQQKEDPSASSCFADILSVGSDLNDAAVNILSTIMICDSSPTDECKAAISDDIK